MINKPIEIADLSKYRSQLMGAAMIMVMLFHVGGMRHDTIAYCVSRVGNVGVDLFLFLSGIGLLYSWTKTPQLRHFFVHRYIRVYPAWLIIACLYYIPLYIKGKLSFTDTFLDIAINWSFWEHDELTFWFIPAIMMLYTVAPAYMELIRRHPSYRWMPVAAMLLCVLIQYLSPLHHAVGHLEIFFSRIPIFLLGINAGQWIKDKRTLEPSSLWIIVIVFAMSAVACVNFENGLRPRFPLFLERMVYIPLTVTMMLLLCRLFAIAPSWVNKMFVFVGGISLELYLIHIHFVLNHISPYHLGYWLTSAVVISISVVLAWLLHGAINIVVKRIPIK